MKPRVLVRLFCSLLQLFRAGFGVLHRGAPRCQEKKGMKRREVGVADVIFWFC